MPISDPGNIGGKKQA